MHVYLPLNEYHQVLELQQLIQVFYYIFQYLHYQNLFHLLILFKNDDKMKLLKLKIYIIIKINMNMNDKFTLSIQMELFSLHVE